MNTSCLSSRRVSISLAVLCTMFLASCTQIDPLFKIRDICTPFDDLPFVDVTAPAPQVAFEIQGQIIVMHGFGSAKLDSGRREIKVAQSVSVPDYANHATVFLNGGNWVI